MEELYYVEVQFTPYGEWQRKSEALDSLAEARLAMTHIEMRYQMQDYHYHDIRIVKEWMQND